MSVTESFKKELFWYDFSDKWIEGEPAGGRASTKSHRRTRNRDHHYHQINTCLQALRFEVVSIFVIMVLKAGFDKRIN